MGTKYSTVTISGYNSNAPADDGSQTAANQGKWSTIKQKLGDPIKTALESVNTALVAALDTSTESKTTNYNTVAGDHAKTIQIGSTTSSGITISLGDAATMTDDYYVIVVNSSTISQTVGRVTSGDTINMVAGNVTIPTLGSATFKVNSGANGYNIIAWNVPGTQGLHTYTEGTWTPTPLFGGAAVGLGFTSSGRYTRIGRTVFIDALISLSAKGSSTGAVTISGLPFVAGAFSIGTIRLNTLAAALNGVPTPLFESGQQYVSLQFLSNGSSTIANITDANFSDTTDIVLSGSYSI